MVITKQKQPNGWLYHTGHLLGFMIMGTDESVTKEINKAVPITKNLTIKFVTR